MRKLQRKQREAEEKDREQKLQEEFEEEVKASSMRKNKNLADMVAEDRVREEEPNEEEQPQLAYEAPKINYLTAAQLSPPTNEDPDAYDSSWARFSMSTVDFGEDEIQTFDDTRSLTDKVFASLRKPKLPKRGSIRRALSMKRRPRAATDPSLGNFYEEPDEDFGGERKRTVSETIREAEDEQSESPVDNKKNAKNLEDQIFPTDMFDVPDQQDYNEQVSSFLNKPYSVEGSDSSNYNLPEPPPEFYESVQPLDNLEDDNEGQSQPEGNKEEKTQSPALPPRSYKNNKNTNNLTNNPLGISGVEENATSSTVQPQLYNTEDAERPDVEIQELDDTRYLPLSQFSNQEEH